MINKLKTQNSKLKTTTQNLKFYVLSFSFALCALRFALCAAFAQPISSTELINNAKQFDGKTIVYEGEVIGDIMVRGKYAWININDGNNAIGVWIDKNLTQDILYTGSYKSKGDWVEITGVFHRTCQQHGGDLDIHAGGIRKRNPGRQIQERLHPGKGNLVLLLLGILCMVWILRQLKRR